MTGSTTFPWVDSSYREVRIPLDFELSPEGELLSLRFPSTGPVGREFTEAYKSSPALQDAVDDACLASAGRHVHLGYSRSLN